MTVFGNIDGHASFGAMMPDPSAQHVRIAYRLLKLVWRGNHDEEIVHYVMLQVDHDDHTFKVFDPNGLQHITVLTKAPLEQFEDQLMTFDTMDDLSEALFDIDVRYAFSKNRSVPIAEYPRLPNMGDTPVDFLVCHLVLAVCLRFCFHDMASPAYSTARGRFVGHNVRHNLPEHRVF